MRSKAKVRGPLLTIVIPVYQVEAYLQECLDSVLHQHFSDWEALCVYDDSTDQSLETLNAYAQSDSRIQIIYGRGKGLSGARNDGILKARGEYILFLDSDDYYPDGALDRIIECMEKQRPDILVFNAHIVPKTPRAPMFYSNYLTTRNVVYEPFRSEALFKELGAKPFVWRNCFSTRFLRENDLCFDEELRIGEDMAFQMIAFPLTKRISFVKDKLYCYRWIREGSLQYGYNLEPEIKLRGHIEIIEHTKKALKARGIYQSIEGEWSKWAFDFLDSELRSYPADTAHRIYEAIRDSIPAGLFAENYTVRSCIPRICRLLIKLGHSIQIHGVWRTMLLIIGLAKNRCAHVR